MMGNKHLFYFITSNNAMNYGIGTYLKHLIDGIGCQNAMKITVVHCLDERHDSFAVEFEDNIRHIFIPKPRIQHINIFGSVARPEKLRYANRICTLLTPFLKDSSEAIIHFNQSLLAFLAVAVKERFDVPILFTVHFMSWQFLYEKSIQQYAKARKELEDKIEFVHSFDENERSICEVADQVICLTNGAKDFILQAYACGEDKVRVIKNGVFLGQDFRIKNPDLVKSALGFDSRDIILLSVGRVTESKGIRFLLAAAQILVSRHGLKNLKLVIVGAGNFEEYLPLCAGIWNNVVWTGAMSGSKVDEVYSIADIGICTSFFEQCSYSALEMIKYGLPVVYAANEGLSDILEHSPRGFKVSLGFDREIGHHLDVQSIVDHILFLIARLNGEQVKKIRRRLTSDEVFSLDRWIGQMEMVYENLVVENVI